jgi:hypothetical protein
MEPIQVNLSLDGLHPHDGLIHSLVHDDWFLAA